MSLASSDYTEHGDLSSVGPTCPLTGHAAWSEHAVSGHKPGIKRWVRRQSTKQLPRAGTKTPGGEFAHSGSEARLHPHQRAQQLTHLPGTQRGSEPAAPRPAGISSYSSGALRTQSTEGKAPSSCLGQPSDQRRPGIQRINLTQRS